MIKLLMGVVALLAGGLAHAEEARVFVSPVALPADHMRPRVFLGGSIDMGNAPDWQKEVIAALGQDEVDLLNPRRADWNPAWKPVASEPNFRTQVEWELAALDSADIVIMNFSAGSQAPVSLLEMGLHARGGKLIVLCPEGYWRKGNVDITAARYGVKQVADLPELLAELRKRLAAYRQAHRAVTANLPAKAP
ncbi:hypothetical protein EOE18_15585 [Novosphingobium umbonatum]|uniref:Nucleoside 2-deoxyribosyltransferase n=1 Tax=Novosphingobium umbonatum TaxID=1908524 RepID=A0A3S2VBG4_9SPHN|nr:nucleoside 2-deoxyribosyltransferase domain-containing protein [Novosphingobium umbonatum]RVU03538.1 hypothetical protein EOE18_15585 [Novosphingobium umbonatum]